MLDQRWHNHSDMLKLSWKQLAAWRSAQHHLDQRAPVGSMLVVASRLCGLHAQLMSSAELSVWARVEDLDRRAIQRALWEERTLVKTWAMRGTLHLLPASELRLWHAALGTSPRYLRPKVWRKYFGITLEELDQLTEAIATALDGQIMTREQLMREVERLTGSKAFANKLAQSSWGTILKPAAFKGGLCFAPSLGQRVRFTHPASWLAATEYGLSPPVDPKVATAEITRRFLMANAPATYQDLARWWTGGGIATARQWMASLGEEVCPVDVEGTKAWMFAAHASELRQSSPIRSVRLLPAFDQYVVAASFHAERLLPGVPRDRIYRAQGWISPVLLINGRMEGIWRHEIKGSRVDVVIEPFIKVPLWVRRAAEQEAERLAGFLSCNLTLAWKG